MDVTALSQIKPSTAAGKGSVSVDEEAFAGEMQKLTNTIHKKDTLDSAEDLSQSLDESEVEESLDEEEALDFTLVYPFLRLNSDIESLSKGEQLKTLHIQDLPIDKQLISELTEPAQDNGIAETLVDELTQSSERNETVTNHPELNGAKLSETATVESTLTETKTSSEITDILKAFNSELAGAEQQTEEKTPIDQKPEQAAMSKFLSTDTQSLERKKQHQTTEAPIKVIAEQETPVKNEGAIPVETKLISETDLPEAKTPFSELGTDLLDELNDSTQTSKTISNESNTQTILPNRQLNSATIQPAETPQVPVTKEQSVEIIKDMMMTVVTDESGKEMYKSTLTLTPETLGEVKIELTYNEKGLSGKLVFESDETRKWMESQWQQLKQPLETKGLTLNQFDFSVTEPNPMTQTDSQSFSQEFDQAEQQASKESQAASANNLNLKSEEETEQAENKSSVTGLNIYA